MSAEPRESPSPSPSPSPSEYRATHPFTPPPREYKPPSMLAEYRHLALAFAALLAAFLAYGWHVSRQAAARRPVPNAASATPAAVARPAGPGDAHVQAAAGRDASKAADPIYIEALPEPRESR